MLPEVVAEIGQGVERDAVPETAVTLAPEQSLAHCPRDREI